MITCPPGGEGKESDLPKTWMIRGNQAEREREGKRGRVRHSAFTLDGSQCILRCWRGMNAGASPQSWMNPFTHMNEFDAPSMLVSVGPSVHKELSSRGRGRRFHSSFEP